MKRKDIEKVIEQTPAGGKIVFRTKSTQYKWPNTFVANTDTVKFGKLDRHRFSGEDGYLVSFGVWAVEAEGDGWAGVETNSNGQVPRRAIALSRIATVEPANGFELREWERSRQSWLDKITNNEHTLAVVIDRRESVNATLSPLDLEIDQMPSSFPMALKLLEKEKGRILEQIQILDFDIESGNNQIEACKQALAKHDAEKPS